MSAHTTRLFFCCDSVGEEQWFDAVCEKIPFLEEELQITYIGSSTTVDINVIDDVVVWQREPMPQRVSPPAPKKTGAAPSSTLRSVPAPSSAASQLLIPSKPAVEATSLSNDEALKPAMAILSSFKKDKGKDKIIQVCVLCWAHSCMITCCNVVDTHVCCRSRHPNCCPVL